VNYSVAWSDIALAALAAVWNASSNRNAVTRAADRIERAIAADPHGAGVPTFDTVYELALPPLAVEYEVVDADCRAFILTCWDPAVGRPNLTGN
jgi:hypothetical protein